VTQQKIVRKDDNANDVTTCRHPKSAVRVPPGVQRRNVTLDARMK